MKLIYCLKNTYPLVVSVFAFGVVVFLLMVVVPMFANMFANMDQDLPIITVIVMEAGQLIGRFWWLLLGMLQEANKLVVAMADPMDFFAIEDLRMMTSFQIEPVLALRDEITRAIERTYQLDSSVVKEISMQAESAPKESGVSL